MELDSKVLQTSIIYSTTAAYISAKLFTEFSVSHLRASVVVLHHARRLHAHVDGWRAAHHIHGLHHVHARWKGH